MTDIGKEAVEAIAAEYDRRVEMHAQLAAGPYGELRTTRGDETAKTHSQTAALLRALSARVEDLEAKEARWKAASSLMIAMIDAYQRSEQDAETPDDYAAVFRAWDRLQDAVRDIEALKEQGQ